MKLLDYIPPRGLLPGLDCQDPEEVVARLVATLVDAGAARDPDHLVAEILCREQKDSTAIGGGLAVPHARSQRVARLQIAAATLSRPLAIPAGDDQPVDVFFLILGSATDPPREMLRALARLARLVKHGSLLADLRRAGTPAAMRTAIAASETQHS